MESADLLLLVEHLEDNIDDLEESLEPLLSAALTVTTKKLPILDQAKIYILIVYAIESLLFSYLRLNGVNAKEHPVFKELTRVKQYFEKIKSTEAGPGRPRENLSLNKRAAGRMIKYALSKAGNDKYDMERTERKAKEKLLARKKLKDLEQAMQQKPPPVNKSSAVVPEEAEADDDNNDEDTEDMVDASPLQHVPNPTPQTVEMEGSRKRKSRRKPRMSAEQKRARKAEREKQKANSLVKEAIRDSG